MPPVIAVAGKGGSGKTTLAALLIRSLLARDLRPVLAVDADPNCNLGEALGISTTQTLGSVVETFQGERNSVPAGMSKGALLEMRFASIIEERTGYDLISMGRGEGPGCYCSINNVLRLLVEKLMGSYKSVVIDNEAGLEHLSRRTSRKIDMLLIVSDFAVRGMRAAERVAALVDELNLDVKNRMLVVSRAPAEEDGRQAKLDRLIDAAGGTALERGGLLPEDEELVQADLKRSSVLQLSDENAAAQAAAMLLDKVLEKISA